MGSIDSVQIANGAVTSEKLAAGTIESSKIATGAVTGDKIAPGAITLEHFADNPQAGLADGSVTGDKLQDGAVGQSKLAPGLIPQGELVGDAELSALDIVVSAGTAVVRQPVGLFTNSSGDLQAVALTSSALASAYGNVPRGAAVRDYMVGVVRELRDDGTGVVAVAQGAFVSGFSGLSAGQYYTVNAAGTGFATTGTPSEAKAIAVSSDTLRLL